MTSETINQILKFRDDRDWKQFHNPKDLAISISLEAAELLEAEESSIVMTLDQMIADKDLICETVDYKTDQTEMQAIYLPAFYYAEVGVAGKLKRLVQAPAADRLWHAPFCGAHWPRWWSWHSGTWTTAKYHARSNRTRQTGSTKPARKSRHRPHPASQPKYRRARRKQSSARQ